MEVGARETLLIEMCCCPVKRQQFLCSRRLMDLGALVTFQGQSLESSELRCQLSLCWVRCVTGIVTRKKISLRLVSLFSTCSPQEMRLLWAPHGLGRGNRSILSPSVDFDQIWPRGREKWATDSWGETTPSPLRGKGEIINVCFVRPWRILTAPPNAGWSFRQMLVPLQAAKSVSREARM